MALDTNELRGDLNEMVGDLPVTFAWASAVITGTISERSTTEDLQEGGFLVDNVFDLCVALETPDASGNYADTFTTEPVSGDQITIKGTAYRVATVKHSQDDQLLTLGMTALTR